jgi:hypothetical protein
VLASWDPELPLEEPLSAPDCAVLVADLLAPIDADDILMVLERYPSPDPRGEALHDYLLTVLEVADVPEPAESEVERAKHIAERRRWLSMESRSFLNEVIMVPAQSLQSGAPLPVWSSAFADGVDTPDCNCFFAAQYPARAFPCQRFGEHLAVHSA